MLSSFLSFRPSPDSPAIPPVVMSKDPSISSRNESEKAPDLALSDQVDVAAQIAVGGYGETITEEQARRLRYIAKSCAPVLSYDSCTGGR